MEKGIKFLPLNVFNEEGDWKDFYLELKNLKKGDVFYESDNRNAYNYELKATEDARKAKNGWFCKVQKTDGEIIELYVSATTYSSSFPGPNLFKIPQVLTFMDGIGPGYQIL